MMIRNYRLFSVDIYYYWEEGPLLSLARFNRTIASKGDVVSAKRMPVKRSEDIIIRDVEKDTDKQIGPPKNARERRIP